MLCAPLAAQQSNALNDFVIGMFGGEIRYVGSPATVPTVATDGIGKTSQMNVLAADGFNVMHRYWPDWWQNNAAMHNYVTLCKANQIKTMMDARHFYKPGNATSCPISGTNEYNGPSVARPNYQSYITNVYADPALRDYIWGHQITEEATFMHPYNSTNSAPSFYPSHPVNTYSGADEWIPDNYTMSEVPAASISQAISDFSSMLQTANLRNTTTFHKLAVMESHHSRSIHDGTVTNDGVGPDCYEPQDYLNEANLPDVFFEGSYIDLDPIFNVLNQPYSNVYSANGAHYLGTLHSIDYAKSKAKEVHDVINTNEIGGDIHSNPSRKNADFLWFQTYSSIVHGATGVWFWDLGSCWAAGEKPANWSSMNDRYELYNFPLLYKNFVRHLSTELRYLKERGLLSTDPNTVLYSKGNGADPCGIVPSYTSYMSPGWGEKYSENYGLRYTIRTNGDEVIMIVCNPSTNPVNVTLNFGGIKNPLIENTTGVDVLFETTFPSSSSIVNAASYKTIRNSGTNWVTQTTSLNSWQYKVFDPGKTLSCSFAPFDVHVFRFRKSASFLSQGYNNGWQNTWTNNGSSLLGDWGKGITPSDKFIPGDYDGDGDEELLCIQALSSGAWATVMDYNATANTWAPDWSNKGTGALAGWTIGVADKFYSGDFDGDGKSNELLCVQGSGPWAVILRYNAMTNSFNWWWSNNGNGNLSYPTGTNWTIGAADRFVVGDFNGNGEDDDLFCANSTSWAVLHFNTGSSNFSTMASGSTGSLSSPSVWVQGSNDEYIAGDFNGNGIKNELICMERSAGMKTAIIRYLSGAWHTVWTNNGNGNIGGWGIPLGTMDKVLIGDIDSPDNKDEMMFIQRCGGCGWATTEDLSSMNQPAWHWSNHNYTGPQQDFIDNWKVNDAGGSFTNYLFIQPDPAYKKQLLAFRTYGCGNYYISMYRSDIPGGNFRLAEEISTETLIYPNPGSGVYTVDMQGETIRQVQVFDVSGRLVIDRMESSALISLDITTEESGIYLVRIVTDKTTSMKKIIKN